MIVLRSLCLFFGLLLVFSQGCNTASCSTTIVGERLTPSGSHKAILHLRNCGATEPYTTHISILGVDESLGDAVGNVVCLEGDWTKQVVFQWSGPSTLSVSLPREAKVYHRVDIFYTIQIKYEEEGQVDL